MSKDIDLTKLKSEIERRKTESTKISTNLGEKTVITSGPPKDKFLNGLLESLNSGRDTHASKLVKMVDNKVAEKREGTHIHKDVKINEIENLNNPPVVNNNGDRESLLYEEIAKMQKNYMHNQYSPQIGSTQQPITLNEEFITKVITEKFEPIIENALKSTIVNIFVEERIREAINENEDIIRNVVLKTLKELSKKKKR